MASHILINFGVSVCPSITDIGSAFVMIRGLGPPLDELALLPLDAPRLLPPPLLHALGARALALRARRRPLRKDRPPHPLHSYVPVYCIHRRAHRCLIVFLYRFSHFHTLNPSSKSHLAYVRSERFIPHSSSSSTTSIHSSSFKFILHHLVVYFGFLGLSNHSRGPSCMYRISFFARKTHTTFDDQNCGTCLCL